MKNFRIINWILLLFVGMSFTSCFDILEEYEFNADGSGKAKMTIDVSQMMDMMESLAALDSTGEGQQSMDDMFNENSTIETLKQIDGISNIRNLSSKEDKIVGYSYEFANLGALNNALAASSNSMDLSSLGMDVGTSEDSERQNFFAWKGKKFSRVMDWGSGKDEEGETSEDEQYAEMAKMMFADAKYSVRYTFAQDVKKVKKNDKAVIGPDGRTVSIEAGFIDLLDQKAQIGCDVVLKSK